MSEVTRQELMEDKSDEIVRQVVPSDNDRNTEGDGKKTAKPKIVYTASFSELVDIVEQVGKPVFLTVEGNKLATHEKRTVGQEILLPPPRDQLPWPLANSTEVFKHFSADSMIGDDTVNEALYRDIRSHLMNVAELPGEACYDLLTAHVIHTYALENCQYSPIICLLAVPERGKSRLGKAMTYLSYRGVVVESLREAYLLRMSNDLGAMVFFDVRDIWRKAQRENSEDILLHRFERGAKVARVLHPERGPFRDTKYFVVFGPTIISTNVSANKILETRAIVIVMPQSTKAFETDIIPQNALELRERLLAFRARQMGKLLPECKKPAKGRLGDILKPLLQIIMMTCPNRETVFLGLVKELERERLSDRAESIEAEILSIAFDFSEKDMSGGILTKKIADEYNDGKTERSKITSRTVSSTLGSLGIKKRKTKEGMAMVWDENLMIRLAKQYCVDIPHDSSLSSPSSSGKGSDAQIEPTMDKRDLFL